VISDREGDRVNSALESNGYPSKFIYDLQAKRSQPSTDLSLKELLGMFVKLVDPSKPPKSFPCLPYIRGVTKPLTHSIKNALHQSRTSHLKFFNKSSWLQSHDHH